LGEQSEASKRGRSVNDGAGPGVKAEGD